MHVYLVLRSSIGTLVGRHVAFGHSCYLITGLAWGGADLEVAVDADDSQWRW